MLTRLKMRRAQEDAGRQAVQRVLSSPDLVALILEQLPVLRLGFGTGARLGTVPFPGRDRNSRDRWAASQVSAAFRRAALRLPWQAQWGADSASSLRALTILKARNVQAWSVQLAGDDVTNSEQADRDSAAVLAYAHHTETLSVRAKSESALLAWLHDTLVPLPDTQGGSSEGVCVLARLASLSRLTGLQVSCPERWTDATWITGLVALKCIDLVCYGGPPLVRLPALESLCLASCTPTGALEQWAAPRLTALSLSYGTLQLALPAGDHPAQQSDASGPHAGLELSRLRRLEHLCCDLILHKKGLRELVPGLTCLKLSRYNDVPERLPLHLSKGFPGGLKDLDVEWAEPLWPAVFGLQELVSLSVWHRQEFPLKDVATVVSGLTRLPHLKRVYMCLRMRYANIAGIVAGFGPLDALLLSRQGCLTLGYDVYSSERE